MTWTWIALGYLAVGLFTYVLVRHAYNCEVTEPLGVRGHVLVIACGLLWPLTLVLFNVFDFLATRAERRDARERRAAT